MLHTSPSPLRISAVQCSIHWNDVSANLQRIEHFVSNYAATSDLIVFPETITTGFSSEAAQLADREQGEVYQSLLQLSHRYSVALAGSYLSTFAGSIHNVFFLIEPSGRVQLQPKRHLFTPGGEKEFVHPATSRSIFTLHGWRILPIICYDLRFPVWCRNVANEYDLLIAPAGTSLAHYCVHAPWRTSAMSSESIVLAKMGIISSIRETRSSLILEAKYSSKPKKIRRKSSPPPSTTHHCKSLGGSSPYGLMPTPFFYRSNSQ